MSDTIAIRKKVAELCGFTDLYPSPHAVKALRGFQNKKDKPVPEYDLSLDAITQVFDEHGLIYTLQKGIADNGDVGYLASNPKGEKYSDTAAKAMCYLFIHCMKS